MQVTRTGETDGPARGGIGAIMAEESIANASSETQGEPHGTPMVEPHGDATDYKALYEALKVDSRKWESRAKENSDKAKAYDELQAQAKAQEDANKTLEQQVAEIRDQLNASNTANLRLRIASEKGVPADLIVGSTEQEMRDHADALIQYREASAPKPVAPIIPTDGKTPETMNVSPLGEFAHSFFGGN